MTADTWPDPERPGYPLNPERDAYHWIGRPHARPSPWRWLAVGHEWVGPGGHLYQPEIDWSRIQYLGPCLPPTEVQAREDGAAERMRERAEEAVDAADPCLSDDDQQLAVEEALGEAIRNIRALPLREETSDE